MTEAMWVAIIGIAGTIFGAALGALITYLTTKSQISARTNELRQQFEHERKEKQITRLIEKRASYLNPISEHLQFITKSAHYLETKLRDLVMICGNDEIIAWADPRSRNYLRGMTTCVNSISESMDGIEILRVQNTDIHLAGFIAETLTLGDQVSKEISKLKGTQIRHGEGDISDKPNKEINLQCTNALMVMFLLFESIRRSNQRIEEILSGME